MRPHTAFASVYIENMVILSEHTVFPQCAQVNKFWFATFIPFPTHFVEPDSEPLNAGCARPPRDLAPY